MESNSDVIQKKLQGTRLELTNLVNKQIEETFELLSAELQADLQNGDAFLSQPKGKRYAKNELPDKIYVPRESLLTELLKISHFQSIRNIFIALFIVFGLNTIVYEFIDTGRINLDFDLIRWAFGQFSIVVITWIYMMIATFCVFPLFAVWATFRNYSRIGWWDGVWLLVAIVYEFAMLYLPCVTILEHDLPPASSAVIICEQIRLLMKMHAFIRENVVRAVKFAPKKDDDVSKPQFPDFGQYLYFLFCPSLVYRDSYPRTPAVNWFYVFTNFGQLFVCTFFMYYLFERNCLPVFRHFHGSRVTTKSFILAVFSSTFPGILTLLMAFFGVLHSWLNAWAEMLRFADRQFYKDWWNSTNFANYYRTWNIVVHDWIYAYIYKDFILVTKNRVFATIAVFLISACVHEYVIIVSLRLFYPVLFVMFAGIGLAAQFMKGRSRLWNIAIWVGLLLGNAINMCLYSMEFYARQHCPLTGGILDFIKPHSWFC